jgi:Ca2+-binding EF-hand superfamily protein
MFICNIYKGINNSDQARLELGLKQAFIIADIDKTGNITMEELLSVFKKSGVQKSFKGKNVPRVVGMENTMALLLGLVGSDQGMFIKYLY